MQDFSQAWLLAFDMIISLDADLLAIIMLSLRVSLTAVLVSALIGFPIGALLASVRFPTRGLWILITNAAMGLPPVVVGLFVYMALSKSGPLGWLDLLYSPAAMMIAQSILITPIIIALTRQTIAELDQEYHELFTSLNIGNTKRIATLLFDGRYSLLTVALAGFGRAIAEVGAVIIVGGNINHLTRVMTTTITLETSKGNLALALALGIILLMIALLVNALIMSLRARVPKDKPIRW